ncbi:uncharacterized protein TRAVEDRAFT_51791 [Trametes versicolor FP-101664 SS1]|uniref:uncharacterized protein n=1 Tax=Trametes versicolor (strain FP-101664) TaxID=717944 RepID=UPI0004621E31|nr:uncharacterized protein TRAVEDRAFT_51791 [Trametes versicolor FP-101664 SS1]EIW54061.1 hypothetical protein TRAVEDRAFT_51791 [Trametes versicolor FP-101664 SS1]
MSTIPALAQRSASIPQTYTPFPSSSTAPAHRTRGIHVIIPSTQSAARAVTPTTTPVHGHSLSSAASSPHALYKVLDTPVTPTHGHGDFVVSSSYHSAPTTPTQARMSARTRRRNSLLSVSSAMEADVDAPSPAAGDLMMSPMEEEDAEHEHEGLHGDENDDEHESEGATGAESKGTGSSVDELHMDAPVLTAA